MIVPTEPRFPSFRQSADAASAAAQGKFLLLNRLQLTLLSAAALASGATFSNIIHQRAQAWTICAIMFLTLGVSTSMRLGKFDDRWFRCRAFAENFKSIVWHYIMSPHSSSIRSELEYLNELKQLSERLPDLQREFARFANSGDLVTDWMRASHHLPIQSKVTLYRELRLEDQISWYSAKAKENCDLENRWFWTIFCVEFAGIVVCAIQAWQLLKFNPISGFAAIGAALVAWSQIKRFSDLGTSYAIAAGDLKRIGEVHRDVQNQAELDAFVQDVETAVSREHSMWLARRVITT